jgi:hypothetical protein
MRPRAALLPACACRRSWLSALLAATLLSACGAGDEQRAASAPADTTRLTVEVTGTGAAAKRIELRCGATRPCERAGIDKLETLADPDAPARACTEQYGGPETARMRGTLEGDPVDVTVTRSDGCGIADYEALFVALGRKPPLAR